MAEETARYWRHPALPGVDLLNARYIRHTFGRHTHDTYVIAAITEGVEEFRYRGSTQRAGAGSLALINPDSMHTGHSGTPDGWRYLVLYPAVEVVASVAEELAVPGRGGLPGFTEAVVPDPGLVSLVAGVHRAAERDDGLTADTLLRLTVARLLRAHGTPGAGGPRTAAGAAAVRRAREILEARLIEPPTLEELAAEVGTRPFPLLRAFRDAHGLPPHAWLNQQRVRRARLLLDTGTPPARAAAEVGFVDQAHLTRHFRRIVGVPPGAYRRERGRG
ncbi:AraC family transcriptional regulator [Peterkaempfera griseoplana]|uniref:AraC family transcriptional regulator n=1 Tax=Peterkaempfera griseoplana TaxID=66896 RepID=UPI0006E37D80|nr:AraC family transcriptional regulator [Peterkaempfera griseoplana]